MIPAGLRASVRVEPTKLDGKALNMGETADQATPPGTTSLGGPITSQPAEQAGGEVSTAPTERPFRRDFQETCLGDHRPRTTSTPATSR